MTEQLIQKALFINFSSHKYKFLNIYFFENESDFLSFMQNGYCYEVEIKISRSDFKADFKKVKHQIHSGNENGKGFYVQNHGIVSNHYPSWELCESYPQLIESKIDYDYRNGDIIHLRMDISSKIEIREVKNTKLPNKFFYAVPKGLITKEEVPEYAGLLYIDEDLKVTKIKDGKFIHKDILKTERAFNKAYYGYVESIWDKLKKLNNIKK